MSKKVIRVALSQESILQAVRELRDYYAHILPKLKEVCRRLAEIGVQYAQQTFSQAQYDGDNDVSVTYQEIENGYKIVASGQAVCFIEFGAGVYYNGNDSYPGNRPAGVVGIGEYGSGKGKRNAWGFYASTGDLVITHGNPPAAAMFNSIQIMKEQLDRIVKEVFEQ